MELSQWLDAVRSTRPLVHNITNLVVNHIAANALLAVGASPVMAYAPEEVSDMASISSALALNMGTLNEDITRVMVMAADAANQAGVPVVFDPVGIGATPYRTRFATEMTSETHLTVLRGNGGEMSVLLGAGGEVKGVDSLNASDALPQLMKNYAKQHGTVLMATGPTDYVTDGDSIWRLSNGHPLLAAITGSGCMLTAIIGGFVGVVPKASPLKTYAEAVMAACTTYNVAAEVAAKASSGPGTFQAQLFDALYAIDGQTVDTMAKIEQVG